LINAIAQVKQMLVTRTTSDSFPKESQELTNASEKIAKNATSKLFFIYNSYNIISLSCGPEKIQLICAYKKMFCLGSFLLSCGN